MLEILAGAFLVSAAHAILPDHWLPLVLISRAERWSLAETLWVTTLVTVPHIASTILVGVVVGVVGFQLSQMQESLMELVAPVMFAIIGLVYVYRHLRSGHGQGHGEVDLAELRDRSKNAIITFMATALFFSPCVPMGSYFLIVGTSGLTSLLLVALVYVSVTMVLLLGLVALGRSGVNRLRWHFLEHNENLITGFILIVLGVFFFLFE